MKITAFIENWRPNSVSAYFLGSGESPTADFLQVWLKSSRSGDVASRSCSPQVTWRLRPPSLYGRRLSRTVPAVVPARLVKISAFCPISARAYIFTISWGKVKNLSRLLSVLSLHRKFIHDHKSCPNSAVTILSPWWRPSSLLAEVAENRSNSAVGSTWVGEGGGPEIDAAGLPYHIYRRRVWGGGGGGQGEERTNSSLY